MGQRKRWSCSPDLRTPLVISELIWPIKVVPCETAMTGLLTPHHSYSLNVCLPGKGIALSQVTVSSRGKSLRV